MHKIHFSSKTIIWETPQDLFDHYNSIYKFNTDVCALPENAKCPEFYTHEINGLRQRWKGTVWMNPHYVKEMFYWVLKAFCEALRGVTTVALLPARTDTKLFHSFIYKQPNVTIEFLKGRLKFGNAEHNAPFPSMIVVFKGMEV